MNVLRYIGILLITCQSMHSYSQIGPNDSLGSMDSSAFIVHNNSRETIDEIICHAKTFEGVRYRYGGYSPSGFDCSGFVKYVMNNFGIDLLRTSSGMSTEGVEVPLSEVQPGDLMFFKGRNSSSSAVGHVVLVTEVVCDDIIFIHAAGNSVKIESYKDNQYYLKRFLKVKRIAID